ncbi:MAG: hypothetical protein IPH09_18110 [bacterium]|nr:hypothetical protein [bacterium]
MLPFVLVLDALDGQEDAGAKQGRREHLLQPPLLAQLRAAHGHGHGEAADDQHQRVEAAEGLVQELVRVGEDLGVVGPVDGVGAEEPAEQQDLGDQEQPHAELAGIVLLRHRLEMVLQVGIGVLAASLVRGAHRSDTSGLRSTYPPIAGS